MNGDPEAYSGDESSGSILLPRPTVAPMVLGLGMAVLAAGVATSIALVLVGASVLIYGLALWVWQLAPERSEIHEPRVDPSSRPAPVNARTDGVGRMHEGMPGYRIRLPTEVHPISAGVKGGIVGGAVMPLPALLWGLSSGHGIWYPVNLLTGLVLPSVDRMTVGELEQFRPVLLLLGLVIHVVNSITFGMIYGVLLPTLPSLPRPFAWGGLLMPMLWTALSYGLMGLVNPLLAKGVDWPWFIASQFLFGVVAAMAVNRAGPLSPRKAGLLGGIAGGLVMPIPALIWSLSSGHGLWYPANLLAALVLPGMDQLPPTALRAFHPGWLAIAMAIHAALSLGLGAAFGWFLPRVRSIPSTLAWGGLLMPLLWTSFSFALMGVVNPLLQQRVDWPWFVASQFVFGIASAVVVERSERVFIPPAGQGPESPGAFVVGSGGGGS